MFLRILSRRFAAFLWSKLFHRIFLACAVHMCNYSYQTYFSVQVISLLPVCISIPTLMARSQRYEANTLLPSLFHLLHLFGLFVGRKTRAALRSVCSARWPGTPSGGG